MNLYVNFRQRVESSKIILVKRSLPGKGQILVRANQEVTPEEILGTANITGGFRSIPLAELLAVPKAEATKFLHRRIGQKIFKGELLAYKKGGLVSGEKTVISPTDGLINSYDDKADSLKIEFVQQQSTLACAVYGIVEKVDNLRGEVSIQTEATVVHGLVGSGKVRDGLLIFLDGRSSLVDRDSIKKSFTGAIVVAGGLLYNSGLMQAVNIGVHGIITGGINSADFKGVSGGRISNRGETATDVGISLIVTEGFGSIPIGEDIYQALVSYQNKFAILDGNGCKLILPTFESSSMARIKKKVLPRGTHEYFEEPQALGLARGLKVRVVSTPYFGEQGEINDIDQTPTKLESGILTYLVTIATRTRKIRVPYTNIEAI